MPVFLIPLVNWVSGAIFSSLMFFISRKGVAITSLIAVIALMGGALTLLISQIDTLLAQVMPNVVTFTNAFLPDNTAFCISAVISCELFCTGYKLTMKLIEAKSRVLLA